MAAAFLISFGAAWLTASALAIGTYRVWELRGSRGWVSA
jgi:hypothetical protein